MRPFNQFNSTLKSGSLYQNTHIRKYFFKAKYIRFGTLICYQVHVAKLKMNSWKAFLYFSTGVCILPLLFPSLTIEEISLLSGIFTITASCVQSFQNTNTHEDVEPKPSSSSDTTDEISNNKDDCDLQDLTWDTSNHSLNKSPKTPPSSALSKDDIGSISSKLQSSDTNNQDRTTAEENFPSICSEIENKTTKDLNVSCPAVTKPSEETLKCKPCTLDALEDVDRMCISSAKRSDTLVEDKISAEPSGGKGFTHKASPINCGTTCDDSDRTEIVPSITVVQTATTDEIVTKADLDGRGVPYGGSVDTVPLEFIYPCLPYSHQ